MVALYGVLRYDESHNLGDEIQSIAAQRLLPGVHCTIDRNTGSLSASGAIKVIYNGWFDGQYCRFPPPQNVEPLFISFHINELDHSADPHYQQMEQNKLSPFISIASGHKEYLQSRGPIGCRDLHTLDLLQKNGIKCYFSGCLTTTLENNYDGERSSSILVVDAHVICPSLYNSIIPESIRKRAVLLRQTVSRPTSHEDKMALAADFLRRLAKAKLVITSRLHTALPCLAFNTPVIFLHHDLKDVRFSGWLPFLKAYTLGDKLDVDLETFVNPESQAFKEMRTALVAKVKSWTRSSDKSIFSVCMNRNAQLQKALPTWLATGASEVVIVDWGSKCPVSDLLATVDSSSRKRIKLIRVSNVNRWVLTPSFNLAAKMTSHQQLLKVDADSLLARDFFAKHDLDQGGVFFAGDWRKARNLNERHTNGIVFLHKEDFFAIGGYNELIKTYGYDDCDLYGRLERRGLKRLLLDLESVQHLEHSNEMRIENQQVQRLDLEVETNRLISLLDIWDGTFSRFAVRKQSDLYFEADFLFGVELNELIRQELQARAIKNKLVVVPARKRKLYINTKNGLGNRLRALISAYNIAVGSGRQLIVIWIPDFHCDAKFTDLFRVNYLFKAVEFVQSEDELKSSDFVTYTYAEHDHVPQDCVVYNYDDSNQKYIDDSTDLDIYVISACSLNSKYCTWEKDTFILRHLEVTDEIGERMFLFERDLLERGIRMIDVIGVHIRMGQPPATHKHEDTSAYNERCKAAIAKWRSASHWSAFTNEMKRVTQENPSQVFLLCCDNEEAYREVEKLGLFKLVGTKKAVFDRSLEQVKSALADLGSLARCLYILGSNWSSFTEIAHRLSGRKLKLAGVDFY